MNKRDRDNLQFLMNAGEQVLSAWFEQADADDVEYAEELLAAYEAELDQAAFELVTSESNIFVGGTATLQ